MRKNKKRHLNEAWFDDEDLLWIYKRKNSIVTDQQFCCNDPVPMFSDDTDENGPIPKPCGLWCPKCKYMSNNKISVCGEIYLAEEYYKEDELIKEFLEE